MQRRKCQLLIFCHIHNDQSQNCKDHNLYDRTFIVNTTQRIIADATMDGFLVPISRSLSTGNRLIIVKRFNAGKL